MKRNTSSVFSEETRDHRPHQIFSLLNQHFDSATPSANEGNKHIPKNIYQEIKGVKTDVVLKNQTQFQIQTQSKLKTLKEWI